MTDREKVVQKLEEVIADAVYPDRPRKFMMPLELAEDALALLKAQEPVEPKIVDTSNSKLYHNDMFKNHYCGNCGEFLHVVNRKDLFCSQCGQAVKWE